MPKVGGVGREGVLGVGRRTGGRRGPKEGRWGRRPSNWYALRWANWEQAAHPNLLFPEPPTSPLPPWHGKELWLDKELLRVAAVRVVAVLDPCRTLEPEGV